MEQIVLTTFINSFMRMYFLALNYLQSMQYGDTKAIKAYEAICCFAAQNLECLAIGDQKEMDQAPRSVAAARQAAIPIRRALCHAQRWPRSHRCAVGSR
jgi:hypothetical protein